MITLIGLLAVTAAPSGAAWCEKYHGRVVDAESGEPLEGAVVVVQWTKKPILSMDGPQYTHKVIETLTDEDGRFSLPACRGIDWNPSTFVFDENHTIFKPGYGPWPISMPAADVPDVEATLRAGATVELVRLKKKEEIRYYLAPGDVGIFISPGSAEVRLIPNLMRLLNIHARMAGVQPYPEH